MRNIKLLIEYDGTNYFGWQKQKLGTTVQGTIEIAIKKVTGEDVKLIGSSRTDSGVHARGYVANFKTNSSIPGNRFKEAINTKLPDDIVILNSLEVMEEFHARYNSKGKTYTYTVLNSEIPSAIGRSYSYHVRGKINIEKMTETCKYFIGTHDFKAFKSDGSSVKTTIRTISDLHIEINKNKIKFFITGDGFLYNMVRIIVGTLLQVGRGTKLPIDIKTIIDNQDRKGAGMCVPALGLVLEEVFY
ncbi:tRNA pseudouridine(38-40) synthase TruA [Clostridium gasigenes]|uniref:tRNA pseudouridine synthase A n=1 Tax=Clostridium gasigenes TaxID=94869 RepID=A0A1H0SK49_9CLOT|nr:tRNA pseudouridine(38-40) synthase TruA [Clostridium gasigenes]MBB6624968.1 tRNA pseudouridine(38-40) synthase TruA [Clostridium gasigenes]MBU3089008.1 tRNA pseudouridine(38-40) synthase TruA [Clostridium gasigenes]MBU3133504.1 tRNA pseudouridine(38-40) synthase TruA [Clostridium gasigenes]SDP42151.1 tRNA pseudouridine38-40 synthase [Clostridium gasigenes]